VSPLEWLFGSELVIAGAPILVREIVGNVFGIASAVGGMRRRVWAWPVGIVGNVLLFTCLHRRRLRHAAGQAAVGPGRPAGLLRGCLAVGLVALAAASRDCELRQRGCGRPPLGDDRRTYQLLLLYAAGTAFFWWLFGILGSYGRLTEAWILTGSILATYGMARGWVEFWLIWLAVDAVGVPTLINAGFYPPAVLYGVYGVFCVWGFVTWLRVRERPPSLSDPASETVGV
jgi:nicotinamide mononucleotide transporter